MPYHIDEENSELAFEVREGNKLVIKIKSNIFSDSLELYLIKVGDNTEPTDKNVFSSLRVLKEIENLHDTILKEINSVTSGFWELKQDSQGNEYISTKYNVLTEGGLTTYGLGEQKLGTIYDGLPIDNDTIYWEEVEGSRVLKAKGSGGGSTGLDETKLWNVLGTPGDQQIDYSHLRSAFSQFSNEFVTINTEQEITALKHFTAGLSVGESKKKIYEENGVVYIDADVAVTGAMTFYASAGRTVSTIMDAVAVDGITIKKENNVLKAIAGAGSSFDENAMWSALSGSSNNQINKSHLTTALDGYATRNWVIENYATKSELSAVSNKLNDFLEGSDTDEIINKWKELEAFLSGMAETDNLAEILETKADKKYVDSTFVTLATKQTITGEKTFSSVLNTAAIKASGAITAPSLAASDWVTIAGIKLRKLEDGALMLEGNLAVTGGITTYAIDPVSASTIMDGVVVDGVTIKKENGKLVAVGGGEAGSVAWGNISGKPSVFPTNIVNITDLHSSWDAVLKAQKPNWLTAVSIATISDLHANWDALLKAAPSAYVTRWPTISEVTGKQNLIVKLNGGATEGTNQFTYNATGAKTINITPAGIGAAASSHNHSWSNITSGKPTTLAGYGITDAYTKTESDNRYLNVSGGDTIQGLITINHTTLDDSINIIREGSNNPTICFSNKTKGQLGRIGFNNEGKVCVYFRTSSDESYVWHSTNDGAGSGLDADLLDGTHKSGLLTALTSSSGTNISITVGGTTKSIADLYANSAYKLENTHTIWGQNFNGTQNITGRFTSNERVYADKGIWVTNNDIAGWGQSNAALNLSIPNTSNTSGIICVYRSEQGNIGSTRFFSMEISNSSDSVRTYYANEVRIDITPTYMDINKQLNINGNTIIGGGGNLGVGTSNPAAKLHVIGDILATGGGTYYGSDIRYKSIMQQVKLSLSEIAKAPSFVYHWNKEGMKCDRLNLGGSAQYTQTILPWAVEEKDNFLSMDYATVAYTFAVHTARHLMNYETRTDKKIKKLENRVKYLEKQLKKLGYEEVRTLDDQSV